jgi:hypothetical protein
MAGELSIDGAVDLFFKLEKSRGSLLKKIEREAGRRSYDDKEYINIQPAYGKKQIAGSILKLFSYHPSNNPLIWGRVFAGVDRRSVASIYDVINTPIRRLLKKQLLSLDNIDAFRDRGSEIVVAKLVKPPITEDYRNLLENLSSTAGTVLCARLIKEMGLKMSHETLVVVFSNIYMSREKLSAANETLREPLDKTLKRVLGSKFKKTDHFLSFHSGELDDLVANTYENFVQKYRDIPSKLYAGEMIKIQHSDLI